MGNQRGLHAIHAVRLGGMVSSDGLKTAWHLTDIANLQTIATEGLLSMETVRQRKLPVQEVGWDGIRNRRATGHQVLTFVQPYNIFVRGRIERHQSLHPNGIGLCLLEIDLAAATVGREDHAEITSGNSAKRRLPVSRGPLSRFVDVLDWGPLLASCDSRMATLDESSSEERDHAGQSEILLPSPVPASAIRRVWIGEESKKHVLTSGLRKFQSPVAQRFFHMRGRLPALAEENFRIDWFNAATPVTHRNLGPGQALGSIGKNLNICKFSAGIRVLPCIT